MCQPGSADVSLALEFLLEFARRSLPFLRRPYVAGGSGLWALRVVSNPFLGGAEAEGFGVGIDDEAPTPALRATPPERGFF